MTTNPKVRLAAIPQEDDARFPEQIATRVLLTQAECVSDGSVDAALSVLIDKGWNCDYVTMRLAIAAALRFEAGE